MGGAGEEGSQGAKVEVRGPRKHVALWPSGCAGSCGQGGVCGGEGGLRGWMGVLVRFGCIGGSVRIDWEGVKSIS